MTRRQLLGLMGAGLVVPRRALAAGTERRFLFVYNRGGWDTTRVFLNKLDDDAYDTESDATVRSQGISWVDHAERPAVTEFMETYGDRASFLHGYEVRSVTHERCRLLSLTGSSESGVDDWGAVLAAHATTSPLLPHVVISGPAFTTRYTDRVVRVGSDGQLGTLLDGTALLSSDIAVVPPMDAVNAHVEDYVLALAQEYERSAADASALSMHGGVAATLRDLGTLQDRGGLQITRQTAGCMRDLAADCSAAFDLFSQGLARCAMVEFQGWCGESWDTHQANERQSLHFQTLFEGLVPAMAELDSRYGVTGAPLADEVVVVVFSEMGRHPRLNTWDGKDHWTYTSAMLLGAGVRGGVQVGDQGSDGLGVAIDLATGEPSASGTTLLPGHLGATLLALGDVDGAEYLPQGEQPITALMV